MIESKLIVALELLSLAVHYAANDSEHANFEILKLDILLNDMRKDASIIDIRKLEIELDKKVNEYEI